MKPSVFFYNIGQGFKGFFRNGAMTTASIIVLVLSMLLVGTFYLVVDTIDRNFNAIENLNVIEVMVDKDFTEDDILMLGRELAKICDESPVVEWTEKDWPEDMLIPKEGNFIYLSPDDHYALFKEMYEGQAWVDAMKDPHSDDHDEGEHLGLTSSMTDNPLRGSFRITFVNLSDIEKVNNVKSRIDEITFTDANGVEKGVETENIKDHLKLYDNVMNIKNTIWIAGIVATLIFLAIAWVFIMITIRLGVFARKNEITFMRLCGATKSFIRMPFVVEGIIIGIVSAVISFGIEYYVYDRVISEFISSALGTGGLQSIAAAPFFETYGLLIGLFFIALGVIAGVFASIISVNKHINA